MQSQATLSHALGRLLGQKNAVITAAESCTGGLISSALTDTAGSSAWFEQGFVTYSNQAKQSMLGVSSHLLENHGAVSEEVVRAMLLGALSCSGADFGVAVSGIAGPAGGSVSKPVGTVWIAWGCKAEPRAEKYLFDGDRAEIRHAAVLQSLVNISAFLELDT